VFSQDRTRVALWLIGDRELAVAWEEAFAGWGSEVVIREGRFQAFLGSFDALVSPGNSYGQMDGGIDRAITDEFPQVQRRVWEMIAEQHHGYQPVGTATVLRTGDNRCPYLVHAPTMRMPMRLTGPLEVSVYDAMWAALLALEHHNRSVAPEAQVTTLACPGLGTGYGGVAPERAAQLMAAAYRHWRGPPDLPISARERDLE
jgi:O-acetyl-ADP-ribose deacetylase (regulator of RNase III)